MALWLKWAGYSVSLRNILPTFIDLIRALSSWLGTTLAGCLSLRGLFTFQASFVLFALIVLSIWNVPDGLKFCAFYFGGFSGMASPILYSFVNTQLKESYGERGLVISSMMTLGFCSQIWVPLFTYPTVQAPQFPHGYPASTVFEFAMSAILMFGVWYMPRWNARRGIDHGDYGDYGDYGDHEISSVEKRSEEGSEEASEAVTPDSASGAKESGLAREEFGIPIVTQSKA